MSDIHMWTILRFRRIAIDHTLSSSTVDKVQRRWSAHFHLGLVQTITSQPLTRNKLLDASGGQFPSKAAFKTLGLALPGLSGTSIRLHESSIYCAKHGLHRDRERQIFLDCRLRLTVHEGNDGVVFYGLYESAFNFGPFYTFARQ